MTARSTPLTSNCLCVYMEALTEIKESEFSQTSSNLDGTDQQNGSAAVRYKD